MRQTLLHDNWSFLNSTLRPGHGRPNEPPNIWRSAAVPGCIHDDLIRHGIIADPFTLEHEVGCQWVGEEDWTYRTHFTWSPDADLTKQVLRFEGLDTVCTLHLNGSEIAHHNNMFTPLEIAVSGLLRSGENELEIRFESAVRIGIERRKAYFEANEIAHDVSNFAERAFVRKVQCMSGWDWGPRLVSCGIWKSVALVEYSSRINSFTVFQEKLHENAFRVWSETVIEGSDSFTTEFEGKSFNGDFDTTVENPKLWWPSGEGEQPLYNAKARLSSGQEIVKKIGLRTIQLLQNPDDLGTSFEFEVNGRRIYSRGANWIPNDCFPSRITDADYREQVQACAKLNMNMLRVWGGGLYEQEGFYDACDEFGILVWQDFPFACSYYPDDQAHQDLLAKEAEVQVKRLRDRTSLALWCGNNENDVMWSGKWGGPEHNPKRYYGDNLYAKTLPAVCANLDPGRAYIRSSPIGSHDETKSWGDEHYWDVWHGRGDWHYYAESLTRFSSEFGFCSACGPEAWQIAGVVTAEATQEDGSVRWHDKTRKPWDIYRGLVEIHYPKTEALEDWIYTSQLNQRDAFRYGIEHYRTNPFCRGTLIWQFNDCWPVQSWAVQDSARRTKIAGFELERVYAPVLVSLRVEADEIVLAVANDSAEALSDSVSFTFYDLNGAKISSKTFPVQLNSAERKIVAKEALTGIERSKTVAVAELESFPCTETWRTLADPKDMQFALPKLSVGADLTLKVEGFAFDAVVDDPDQIGNLEYAGLPLPGIAAKTLYNETVKLCAKSAPKRIRVRSLAGVQVIEI